MATVLIVEDEEGIQHLLKRVVAMLGHEAYVAGTGAEALSEARRLNPHLIVTDLSLPGNPNGIELVRALRALNPARPIVVTTGYTVGERMEAIEAEGIQHVLGKPFDVLGARTLIATLIGNARAN
jgi:CheY-like chemotaxis protein